MMSDRIVSDQDICGGEPTIKGTRIPVRVVLSHLAAGEDASKIIESFPNLIRQDVQASLEYAAELAGEVVSAA